VTPSDLLLQWLPLQRWFSGKGRTITSVTPGSTAVLRMADPRVELSVFGVTYDDGGSDDYQLLLGRTPGAVEGRLEHAVLGTVEGELLYDAVYDPVATTALLERMAAGGEVDGVVFTHDAEIDPTLTSRVLSAEQSNTSIVFGDSLILKLFRRLQPGANPDIEVTKALADAGSPYVAQPLAWLDGTLDGQVTTLGLAQPASAAGTTASAVPAAVQRRKSRRLWSLDMSFDEHGACRGLGEVEGFQRDVH